MKFIADRLVSPKGCDYCWPPCNLSSPSFSLRVHPSIHPSGSSFINPSILHFQMVVHHNSDLPTRSQEHSISAATYFAKPSSLVAFFLGPDWTAYLSVCSLSLISSNVLNVTLKPTAESNFELKMPDFLPSLPHETQQSSQKHFVIKAIPCGFSTQKKLFRLIQILYFCLCKVIEIKLKKSIS